jgi:hypothetical protein
MATTGEKPKTQGRASLEITTPAPLEFPMDKRLSVDSIGPGAAMDHGKEPVPATEPYVVDSEKQSEKVGSLHAGSGTGEPKHPALALWQRHWKKVAQLAAFMVFTAFVSPATSLTFGRFD